jgi:uncharacterized FlaG/YvyC family protein
MDIEAISPTQDVTASAQAASAPPVQPNTPNGSVVASASTGTSSDNATLADTLGSFLGTGSQSSAPASTSVSYRIEKPDEIVTVISDHTTGREIAQFPTQTMIDIAQFFATEQGVTFDRNA